MHVIIAGTRTLTDIALVERAVAASGFTVTAVISGAARGVDQLGEQWAAANYLAVHRFPAQWHVYGAKAGPLRNQAMVKTAGALIAIWDGRSRGTADIITRAWDAGLPIHVERVGPYGPPYRWAGSPFNPPEF